MRDNLASVDRAEAEVHGSAARTPGSARPTYPPLSSPEEIIAAERGQAARRAKFSDCVRGETAITISFDKILDLKRKPSMHLPHILVSGEAGHGKDTVGNYLVENYDYRRTAFGDPLKEEVFGVYEKAPEHVGWSSVNDRSIKEVPLARLALAHCSDAKFVEMALDLYVQDDVQSAELMRNGIRTLFLANPSSWTDLNLLGVPARKLLDTDLTVEQRLMHPRSFRRVCQVWGTEYRRGQGCDKNYWVNKIEALINAADHHFVVTDGRFHNECDWAADFGLRRIHVARPMDSAQMTIAHDASRKKERALADAEQYWLKCPNIESLMVWVHAKMTTSAPKTAKHSSEMIPPVDAHTADLLNNGTVAELHEKAELSLQGFIRDARPKLSI